LKIVIAAPAYAGAAMTIFKWFKSGWLTTATPVLFSPKN